MSRTYNIRWTENDSKELSRAVKNFNAKVRRLEKKYAGQDVVLPEKVSVKELQNVIGTRRDLNRELKSLQRFSQRGAEDIVEAPITENTIRLTKWQRTEMNRLKGIINAQRSKRYDMVVELQESHMEYKGEKLPYTVGEFGGMGQQELNALKPVNAFTKHMTKYDLPEKFKALRKHAQSDYFTRTDRTLLENFVGSIEKTYSAPEFRDRAEKLTNAIREMDFKEFYKKFKRNPGEFEYSSDVAPDADLDGYLTKLESTWLPQKKPKAKAEAKPKKKKTTTKKKRSKK